MEAAGRVNVTRLIDEQPLGAMQIRVLLMCGCVALLDGLDLQAIGLAAPSIARMLHVEPRAFGAVFSAALLGLMLGAFTLGPMADRFGRKRILVASTLMFGVFTVATALASSFTGLLVVRFLTGVGLGGAMPSFISLASEYTPQRIRSLMVTVLWAGFPLGGVVGGVMGWQSIFYVGGVAPLVLAGLLAVALPESLGFLVARGAPLEVIRRIVRHINPQAAGDGVQSFVFGEERLPGLSVRHLFTGGRAAGTLLLWVPYFMAFLMLVTNSAWSPTLLNGAGLGVGQSGIIMAAYNGGSVVGTLVAAVLVSRHWGIESLYVALGAPGLCAALFVLLLGLEQTRRNGRGDVS